MARSPVVREGVTRLATNEEATVITIDQGTYVHNFGRCDSLEPWTAEVPSWLVTLRRDDGDVLEVHTVRDRRAHGKVIDKLKDESSSVRDRWGDYHAFLGAMTELRSIYAMTVHSSQGSTFRNCFVDVGDIRRRASSNPLECQQLYYVAATRPTHALVLAGV